MDDVVDGRRRGACCVIGMAAKFVRDQFMAVIGVGNAVLVLSREEMVTAFCLHYHVLV
jgi:hypothetical protein